MQICFVASKDCKQLIGGLNMTPGQIKGVKVSPEFVLIMERHPEAFQIRTPYDDMDPKELEMIEKVFGDDTKDLFQKIEGNAPPKPPKNPIDNMKKVELIAFIEDEKNGLEIEGYEKMLVAELKDAIKEAMAEE